ncbi:uncharacterized protein LOC127280640 isoform X4 [Leptopilina boulardi]|uniref:uncharacterized protein LOC127280640 isoform X4 n=1 Tax=Leptopilina boulardi TaxID=63433 RepID=UPI0021F50D20|nr:uncharacterized protein LOC127280640 isoform X4 [Leptopilina boulardi]
MCDKVEQSKYEVIQRNIFLKCISTRSSRVSSSSSSSALDEEVSISSVIEYLYKSFSDKFHKEFFDDLRKSLIKVAPNGFVNWPLFKEGSRLWISSLQACKKQDGNNNIQNHENKENMYRYVSEWHSDELTRDSSSSGEESKNSENNQKDSNQVCQSSLPFINVVNVSSYSPDSNSTRGESLTVKNKNLQKEIDEQKDLLSEAEEREKSSKLELQKTLKENAILKTKLESVQKHNESINALKNEVSHILQEKKIFKKQYDECEKAYNDKCIECSGLKDTIVELEDSHINCRENYESSIQYLTEKNQELVNQNLELQMKSNNSGSSRLSMTPPIGYVNSLMHSTPYTVTKISPRRSLYAELKASGFSPERAKNDSKIAELEEELNLCNEELNTFSEQIENFIQSLSLEDQKPYVPTLNLENENFNVSKLSILKQEIAILMNLVKERVNRKNEKRDFCLQVTIEDPKVHRQFSGSIENESLALSESSMTSLSANRESEKGSSSGAEISNVQGKSSQVQIDENSIIKPIVEALDQIIQDSIDDVSNRQEELFTKNHKRRCIYTNTRPPTPNPELIIPGESLENDESHHLMSKGDAPDINLMKNSNSIAQVTMQSSIDSNEAINRNKIDEAYSITPTLNIKSIPKRKLSVFQRPFDIESLKANNNDDKMDNKRSISLSAQNKENKEILTNFEKNTYRTIVNNSESSDSASPDKILCQDDDDDDDDISEPKTDRPKIENAIIIAPSKLIFPQKIFFENQTKLKISENNTEICTENMENEEFREERKNITKEEIMESEKLTEENSKLNGNLSYSKVTVRRFPMPEASPFFHFSSNEKTEINENFGVSPSMTEVCSAISNNSGGVESGNEIVNKFTSSVVTAMSSAEDSSDSECDRINSKGDRQVAVSDPVDIANYNTPSKDSKQENEEENREKVWTHKRSLSDSKNNRNHISECHCHSKDIILSSPLQSLDKEQIYPRAFPSFTDDHLEKSGIANYTDLQSEFSENLSEDELEKKYTTFSVGLRTDRMTLSRRLTLSQRQRDQSERNLTVEVEKMNQDIQDLAPLCTDRESLERVERVRLQLEMINQCAHRVSCVAETLGAVHQERRISRAALLADRYLQLLKTRCEKLSTEINETKRILMENNIVIEEHPSELGDDIPRIRYRAVPTNNRTMMARRRASIAAISRPLGSQQDLKEGTRQRNSVSGRVTLRRPSLNYETQKWENEKLVRTDSSSSIGELREIFEQAESRRNSREENNNNIIRNTTNYLISTSYESAESEIWSHPEEDIPQESPYIESLSLQHIQQRINISFRQNNISRFRTTIKELVFHPIFWIWISFFLGIYVNHVFSSKLCVGTPFKWWSIEEMLESYIQVKSTGQRPI